MKCVYFLFIVIVLQESVANYVLPEPNIAALIINEDKSVTLMWYNALKSLDDLINILGFIVNMWVVKGKTVYQSVILRGQPVYVAKTADPELDPTDIPPFPPQEIQVQGADATNVTIRDIKPSVLYHIRVQAYSKNERGPMSIAVGVKVQK